MYVFIIYIFIICRIAPMPDADIYPWNSARNKTKFNCFLSKESHKYIVHYMCFKIVFIISIVNILIHKSRQKKFTQNKWAFYNTLQRRPITRRSQCPTLIVYFSVHINIIIFIYYYALMHLYIIKQICYFFIEKKTVCAASINKNRTQPTNVWTLVKWNCSTNRNYF